MTSGEKVEFVTILLFDSIASITAVAGDDYEKAVIPAERRPYLSRADERAVHYEVSATHQP